MATNNYFKVTYQNHIEGLFFFDEYDKEDVKGKKKLAQRLFQTLIPRQFVPGASFPKISVWQQPPGGMSEKIPVVGAYEYPPILETDEKMWKSEDLTPDTKAILVEKKWRNWLRNRIGELVETE